MYAVIRVGGKQQRVKTGDVIEAEHQKGGEPGSTITFRPILVVDDEGRAHHGSELARASVQAKVVGEQKGDKVKVFKYRPKTRYSRRQGHRQMLSLLQIGEVSLGDAGKGKATKRAAKGEREPEDANQAGRPQEENVGGEPAQREGPGEGGSSATSPAAPTPDQAEGERQQG